MPPRMKKAALFVDVQNIYYTVREGYRSHFNYKVFWEQATKGRKVPAKYRATFLSGTRFRVISGR